jgi:hypothetical protein
MILDDADDANPAVPRTRFECLLFVNDLQARYVSLQDHVFRFSIRRVLPIPFVFEKVDFPKIEKELVSITEFILLTSEHYQTVERDVLPMDWDALDELFPRFCEAVSGSSAKLAHICRRLGARVEDANRYRRTEYDRDISIYNEGVDRYRSMGLELNRLIAL